MAINANVVRIQSMFTLKNITKESVPNVDIKRVRRQELFYIELNLEFKKAFCNAFEMTFIAKSISSAQAAKRYGTT